MGKDRRLDGEIISVSNARCATITTATLWKPARYTPGSSQETDILKFVE